jgi:hypothetical protein
MSLASPIVSKWMLTGPIQSAGILFCETRGKTLPFGLNNHVGNVGSRTS